MPTKVIKVLENQKGRIIGTRGCTIRKLQQDTGAYIDARYERNRIFLKGTQRQIDAAEYRIQAIVSDNSNFRKDSLIVTVPEFAVGYIIGKQGRNLKSMEEETGTQILYDSVKEPSFFVKGNDVQKYKAKLKIKESASNLRRLQTFPPIKKFPFIEDRHVGEDSDFELKLTRNPHPRWQGPHYELSSVKEQHLMEEKDSPDFSDLCGTFQDILHTIQQREDSENLLVDMWCHYGHAYITGVDEDEVEREYSLQEVKEHLKRDDCPWLPSFIGGVHELDVQNFENLLSGNQPVRHYTRCDLSFFSPSCRQIRLKIFLKGDEENGAKLSFCDDSPVVMKNVLEKVSRDDGVVYYLCAPPVQHIKVHIFIPFVNLDCHFMIRTTFRNITRTPEEEAEDKVLIDFLNENLKIINGKLQLPTRQDQLPEGFDLSYWRKSKRRSYIHEGFKIKISEETSENVNSFETGDDVKTRNDVYIRCTMWEEQFSGHEWQPEQIVEGVQDFLSFVRDVQKHIATEDLSQGD